MYIFLTCTKSLEKMSNMVKLIVKTLVSAQVYYIAMSYGYPVHVCAWLGIPHTSSHCPISACLEQKNMTEIGKLRTQPGNSAVSRQQPAHRKKALKT